MTYKENHPMFGFIDNIIKSYWDEIQPAADADAALEIFEATAEVEYFRKRIPKREYIQLYCLASRILIHKYGFKAPEDY